MNRRIGFVCLIAFVALSLLASSSAKAAPLSVLIVANPNYVIHPADPDSIVSFTSIVSGGTSPYFYTWNFGDFGSETTASPGHQFNYAGVFNVTLLVTDSAIPANVFLAYTIVTVVPEPPLVVFISANPNYVLTGGSVSFKSMVYGGTSPYTYAWSFGDSGVASTANPTHIYNRVGVFNVSLLVNDTSSPFSANLVSFVYTTVTVVAAPGGTGLITFTFAFWVVLLIIGFLRMTPVLFLASFNGVFLSVQSFLQFGDTIIPILFAASNLILLAFSVDLFMTKRKEG